MYCQIIVNGQVRDQKSATDRNKLGQLLGTHLRDPGAARYLAHFVSSLIRLN